MNPIVQLLRARGVANPREAMSKAFDCTGRTVDTIIVYPYEHMTIGRVNALAKLASVEVADILHVWDMQERRRKANNNKIKTVRK